MEEHISVREWQKKYKAGEFDAKDFNTQVDAGWYDWFCKQGSLAGRLKKIAGVVMGVSSPYILDNYYVWFKNNCPMDGPLYDDVRFEPLSGNRDGKYFVVSRDCPYENQRWSLYAERSGFETPEFASDSLRDVVAHINTMGQEFSEETTGQTETEGNTCDCGMRGF